MFVFYRISFFSTEYYTSEVQIESIGIKQMYLLTPISIIFWALLFPSWLNFIWILVSWFLFSLIGERHHRLLRAPFILTFASVSLLFSISIIFLKIQVLNRSRSVLRRILELLWLDIMGN